MKNFYDYKKLIDDCNIKFKEIEKQKNQEMLDLIQYVGEILNIKSLCFSHENYGYKDSNLSFTLTFNDNREFIGFNNIETELSSIKNIKGQPKELKDVINFLVGFLDDFHSQCYIGNDFVSLFYEEDISNKYIIGGK